MSAETLAASYSHCRFVARTRARNFYYGFLVLPAPKRDALSAVYAFMRYCDDLSDDEGIRDKADALNRWRQSLDEAYEGKCDSSLILPAFHDAVNRYRIPSSLFHELIDGAEMDLTVSEYSTFDDLYRYCYRVASTVGLTCIHVFGFSDEHAKQLAEWNGIAFQLTNILRDLREDAERGRVYLPADDLVRFGFPDRGAFVREGLASGTRDPRFVRLMEFQVERARSFYQKAEPLLAIVDADSRPALWAMTQIYRGILERIQRSGYDVVTRRITLPTAVKLSIVIRAWLGRMHTPSSQKVPLEAEEQRPVDELS